MFHLIADRLPNTVDFNKFHEKINPLLRLQSPFFGWGVSKLVGDIPATFPLVGVEEGFELFEKQSANIGRFDFHKVRPCKSACPYIEQTLTHY